MNNPYAESSMLLAAKVWASAIGGAVALMADVTIPTGGEEAIWLWRGFVTLCMFLAGKYILSLHRKIEQCAKMPTRLEIQRRYIKAIVNVMDHEGESHGRQRSTDHLVAAIAAEMEEEEEVIRRLNP